VGVRDSMAVVRHSVRAFNAACGRMHATALICRHTDIVFLLQETINVALPPSCTWTTFPPSYNTPFTLTLVNTPPLSRGQYSSCAHHANVRLLLQELHSLHVHTHNITALSG
jgi:hypothetical protein